MNPIKKPIMLIPICCAPQLLAMISILWCAANGVIQTRADGSLWLLVSPLAACFSAALAASCVFQRQGREDTPQALLITLLFVIIPAYGIPILALYLAPLPTQTVPIEVALMGLAALEAAGELLSLLSMRGALEGVHLGRVLGYGGALPFLIALVFVSSAASGGSVLGDVALSFAMAVLCLDAVGFARLIMSWMGPKPGKAAQAPPPETDDAPAADGNAPEGGKLPRSKNPAIVALFALALPLTGLAVNQFSNFNLFDFSSPWFYILAFVNGLLMLPFERPRRFALPLFYLKSVGFGYIAYFALVFIPLMPLGLVTAIVLVGFLFLTPAIAFALEAAQLKREYKSLARQCGKAKVLALMIAGFLTLPAVLGANMAVDRLNYQNAAKAIADRAETPPAINRASLARALTHMNRVNQDLDTSLRDFVNQGFFEALWAGQGAPVIGAIYNRVVFDNIPITKSEATALYAAHFATLPAYKRPEMSAWGISKPRFDVNIAAVRTEFDADGDVYRSWVDLEITNNSAENRREFSTLFLLPKGAYISDYSLKVGYENKRGIITVRKSAEAVYNAVVSKAQDPGLVTFETSDLVRLRVFPFSGHETRYTSIQIMHIAPVSLTIEGQKAKLAAEAARPMPDMKDHEACTDKTCAERLPYTGKPYEDAMALWHNEAVMPGNIDVTKDAIARRVLTRSSAFIVLETAQQEQALLALHAKALAGEAVLPNPVSMDEPGALAATAAILFIMLIYKKKQRTSRAA